MSNLCISHLYGWWTIKKMDKPFKFCVRYKHCMYGWWMIKNNGQAIRLHVLQASHVQTVNGNFTVCNVHFITLQWEICPTTTPCSVTGEDDAIASNTSIPCSTIPHHVAFTWLHMTIQMWIKYPESWRLFTWFITWIGSQACPSQCC